MSEKSAAACAAAVSSTADATAMNAAKTVRTRCVMSVTSSFMLPRVRLEYVLYPRPAAAGHFRITAIDTRAATFLRGHHALTAGWGNRRDITGRDAYTGGPYARPGPPQTQNRRHPSTHDLGGYMTVNHAEWTINLGRGILRDTLFSFFPHLSSPSNPSDQSSRSRQTLNHALHNPPGDPAASCAF